MYGRLKVSIKLGILSNRGQMGFEVMFDLNCFYCLAFARLFVKILDRISTKYNILLKNCCLIHP